MFDFRLSKIERLIVETLRFTTEKRKILKLYNSKDDEKIYTNSSLNRILPIVAHSLNDIDISTKKNKWLEEHEANYRIINSYLEELDRIAYVLKKNNIEIVALKNGGIARGLFNCPGCCPMGDLDLLIEKSEFRKAHKILLEDGYKFKFRSKLEKNNFEDAERNGGAEYWKILPNGEKLWIELQWRPIAGRWIRSDQEPDSSELLRRAIKIEGTNVKLLSPEDNLLQVALHTAKHTYVRAPGFRLHQDVDRIVNLQSINWLLFVKRVKELRVKTPVYFSLYIPKVLFNSPIPKEVLEEISTSKLKRYIILNWIKKVGLFNPDEKKFNKVSYIIFNILLYDDIIGILRSVFPDKSWIKNKYNIKNDILLPFFYFKRLFDLTFRRNRT